MQGELSCFFKIMLQLGIRPALKMQTCSRMLSTVLSIQFALTSGKVGRSQLGPSFIFHASL